MPGAADDSARARAAAERYESCFVPSIGRPVAVALVDAADLRPGARVLDVACGTGIVARLAAERIGPEGRAAGLDPNAAMLEVARDRAPRGAPIRWHHAAAERMPLEGDRFDVVFCGMGLQFFADRLAGLREIRRVLVPGGRLLANLPGPMPPVFEAMAMVFARHFGPEARRFVDLVFSLHDARELRRLAEEAGFRDPEVRSEDVPLELGPPGTFLWGYVHGTPLSAEVMVSDRERSAALERDFVEACTPLLTDGMLKGAVRITTMTAVK